METTSETVVEDATATLVYCIAKHFVGEPRLFQDRSLEILNNLYCKKLTDFRWYKDMFLTKVMIRSDCNNDYWKERFLSGLPPHFAEKVRSKIRDRCEGKIPYSQLSYGDLISIINVVAMELCTDLKLKEQLKKDQKNYSSELGSFCQDFGFPLLKPPSAKKAGKKERTTGDYSRKKRPSKKRRDKPRDRSKKKFKRKTSENSSEETCWTCGKKGHRSTDCPRNKKKKKKVNLLEVDDETKQKLFSIIEADYSQ